MRTNLLLIAAAFIILLTSFLNRHSNGLSSVSSTPYNFSAVDKVLTNSVPTRFGNKCFVLICVNGKPVYTKSFGGYNANTVTFIASCSKWLSGAVLMSMVDDGKLKLSDTVGKFLPNFTKYHKGNITLAQLFSHTSGFPGNSSQRYEYNRAITLAQCADSIAENVPLVAALGKQFYYGGVSMQVAGRICEVVSGEKWSTLFNEKIAAPLGMASTSYGFSNNPLLAGSVSSTPNDYMNFLIMLMNKGIGPNGNKVLSTAAVAAMEQGQTTNCTVAYSPYPASKLTSRNFYGIGNWRDVTGPGDALIENSSPGAFGTHPWIDHQNNVTGIIFTFIPYRGYGVDIATCIKVRRLVRDIVK